MSYPLLILLLTFVHSVLPKRPNFVFVLTDDQDYELRSLKAMPHLHRLVTKQGMLFGNAFVTTPVCCPSRATIFSGRYIHSNRCYNNSVSGGCYSSFWRNAIEPTAFPRLLKDAGYTTFFAGKYMNRYGQNDAGGPAHIPPGWDYWAAMLPGGYFYNYGMSVNGSKVRHGHSKKDYLTTVIRGHAMEFLKGAGKKSPFFLMLGPTAPHQPASTTSKYKRSFRGNIAPRTRSFGLHAEDKHWFVRYQSELSAPVIKKIDKLYRHRLQSLRPVDDMIAAILSKLSRTGLLDNTYVIFASDNGFHLGQFNLPYTKRQPYEFDVRVPFIVRGPGVQPGTTSYKPVLNLDWAPTILDLADIRIPDYMEGLSLKPLLEGAPVSRWRSSFLVEYNGESGQRNARRCGLTGLGACRTDCTCFDARNNTYSCLRTLTSAEDDVYCEFEDNESFVEYYDMTVDREQLRNLAGAIPRREIFIRKLEALKRCSGIGCRIF